MGDYIESVIDLDLDWSSKMTTYYTIVNKINPQIPHPFEKSYWLAPPKTKRGGKRIIFC